MEARYPDDLVIEFLYDGFGRRVITRVNGEGVRHIYDGYLIVQDRKERTDELVAEYTYFQGNIFKMLCRKRALSPFRNISFKYLNLGGYMSKNVFYIAYVLFIITINLLIGCNFNENKKPSLNTNEFASAKVLEDILRQSINKPNGTLSKDAFKELSELDLSMKGITYLKGIELCSELTSLDLKGNLISDINPLGSLNKIKELNISDNQINDISVLRKLSYLEKLEMGNAPVNKLKKNKITDLNSISDLANLRLLYIQGNPVENINALSELENLNYLYAGWCQIADLKPLSGLDKLKCLVIKSNPITDLSPLSECSKLEYIDAGKCKISNISGISGLRNIRSLYLSGNDISDLNPLKDFVFYKKSWPTGPTLDLSNNNINDISALLTIINLKELYLKGNQLSKKATQEDIPLLKARGVTVYY